MAVTDRYNIEESIFVCYKMHEDLIGGVYDHRANPEYPKYPNISAYCAYSCILVIAYWPPAMGIGEHEGSMSRHIILTAIFVFAAITDWFDGYLARTLNQTSAFGRF